MLGLGASRLALTTAKPSVTETSGLAHRVKAMELLRKALREDPKDRDEADARFASLMVLTIQSSCLQEGMVDFLTTLRGSVLSGKTIHSKDASCFAAFFQKQYLNTVQERFSEEQLEQLDPEPLDNASDSLRRLRPYCQKGAEKAYFDLLLNLVESSYSAPKQGKFTSFKPSIILAYALYSLQEFYELVRCGGCVIL